MITIRQSKDRGQFDHGWLRSMYSFSFAEYFDRLHMGFGSLRVINEDFINGGEGFPMHDHSDMEIITYMISGALEHKDSLGSHGVIKPYKVQKMSAGSGITHSEFNHFKDKESHLLQVWIKPNQKSLKPSYEQKNFGELIQSFQETLVCSPDGRDDSIQIYQDVNLWVKKSKSDESWNFQFNKDRMYWIQVVSGNLELKKNMLSVAKFTSGDGVKIQDENDLKIYSKTDSEILLFDMAFS